MCISMHMNWLLLPIILTLVTVVLAIWIKIANWNHRHSRPVWKESLLPLIFYGHRVESREPVYLLQGVSQCRDSSPSSGNDAEKHDDMLLEASTMQTTSKNIAVTFR
jgi:hypothetical protein